MKYSAVIPVHNEEESILPLYNRLKAVLDGLGEPYEIIFVDDASTDTGLTKLETLRSAAPQLVILAHKTRRGQSAALQTGFDAARGELIITLDGDLQNDPEDIPKLLEKIKEGYDVVCGWRKNRKDPLVRKISSRVANAARKLVLGETIHDVGCSLRVFKREVLEKITLGGEDHRFFTAFAAKYGFRVGEAEVHHTPRQYGHSKYDTWKRFRKGLTDLVRIKRMK